MTVISFPTRDNWTSYMRNGFEAFIHQSMPSEARKLLIRSIGGEYVAPIVAASWAAWQASVEKLLADTGRTAPAPPKTQA